MKKNFKVIQLNGIPGLILAILLVLTALAAVIVLPTYGIKFLWNNFLNAIYDVPEIRLAQASLLWFACLTAVYGYLKSKIKLKFVNVNNMYDNMSDIERKKIIENITKENKIDEYEDEKINK